jgi:integrase
MATIITRNGKKGKSYLVRIRRKDSPPLTQSFKSKTKADAWARSEDSKIDNGDTTTAEAVRKTLYKLIIEYEKDGFEGKPRSKPKQLSQLQFWIEKFGNKKLSQITPATICRFRRELSLRPTNRGDKTSNATANRYVSALSGALTYAVNDLGWLKANPVTQVKRLPENPPPVRFLDKKTELPKLTKACASISERFLSLFMMAVGTGLRASALLWLHNTEVDLEKGTIRIPVERSKNGRAFTLGITATLYPYAKYLVENCHPESGLLFPDHDDPFKRLCYRKDWDTALELAGICNFRFHDCRHTCGSYMAMAGDSLTDIAEQLNHKTLEMAKRYSHLADEYRAKIPVKMNETFLSEASALVVHIVDTTMAESHVQTNATQEGTITGKAHLRLL